MSNFDGKARTWDSPERVNMARAIAAAMIAAAKPAPGDNAADYGAGTGLVTFEVLKHVREITAIDTSEGMLAVLREKAQSAGKPVRILMHDIEKSGPVPEQYRLLVSSMTLHHIADTRAAFAAFYAMVETGGTLEIADLDTEDGSFHPDFAASGAKHKGFDRNLLAAMAGDAGFISVSLTTATRVERNGKSYSIFLLSAKK